MWSRPAGADTAAHEARSGVRAEGFDAWSQATGGGIARGAASGAGFDATIGAAASNIGRGAGASSATIGVSHGVNEASASQIAQVWTSEGASPSCSWWAAS